MEARAKTELVFVPYPGRGHLLSTLELVKLLIGRDERLSVTVLLIKPLSGPASEPPSLESEPRIRLVDIPRAVPAGPFQPDKFIESHKDHVRNVVAELFRNSGRSHRLAGFVVDVFCTSMDDVARGLGVPTYVFFTSGAATLGLTLHFQGLVDNQNRTIAEFVNGKNEIPIPFYGSSHLPVELLPPSMFEKDAVGGGFMVKLARGLRRAEGIIVNTFDGLESRALEYISGDERAPPVYPVGPVLHVEESRNHPKHDEIMEWLDRQPDTSVVFLCFGSRGCFDGEQVREIARALENSGHRFLWSLRKPPPEQAGGNSHEPPSEYENPAEVLPEGFAERTEGSGRVIGWAPQAAVLAHRAVGGFVSHCGWNSTLESVWCGVPMAAWPVYAEQPLNAFQLVRDVGAAVEINMRYKKGPEGANMVVGAEEIERGIRRLMEAGSGVRVRMEELRWKSRSAVAERGSSFESIGKFIKDVMAARAATTITTE